MRDELAELPRYLAAHLELTLFALLVGICLSLPLGILAARNRTLGPLALGVAGAVQTIPSLALLALMVPLLGGLGAPNIGFLPAFVALVLYSMLPILRNTVTALSDIDPALVEAARGVGMSSRESLIKVELPTALPVIVAGVRTAMVWTVGAATLATPVGATSLGNYIFSGLQTRNLDAVLVGCVAAAALALTLDALVRLLLFGVERRRPGWMGGAVGAFLALYAIAGATAFAARNTAGQRPIIVGAKTFTEQYVLSEALAHLLERRTDVRTEVKPSLGSSVLFDALSTGSVDVYVEYAGTVWATIMKRADPPSSRADMLAQVERHLRARYGIELVASLGFENSYALAMRRESSQRRGVRTIGELARHSSELSIGGDYEFFARPEWHSMKQRYALHFSEQRSMDASLMYQAVADGAVDVISAFSTDGRIVANDLVVLIDDLGAIPPYDAVILASSSFASAHPSELGVLAELEGRLSAEQMRRLNLAVDRDGRPPKTVAAELVESWLVAPSRKRPRRVNFGLPDGSERPPLSR